MKRIELVVSPQGVCRLESVGFAGAECIQASQSLERALGVSSDRQLTSDYFELRPDWHCQTDASSDQPGS